MIILATPAQVRVMPPEVSAKIRLGLPLGQQFISPLAIPAELDFIDLVAIADPRTPWPRQMRHTTRPTVLLLGDDPGSADGMGGPEAWRCASKIADWAEAVFVHGAGGLPEHYVAAVSAAMRWQRVAFIETTSTHAEAWAEIIECPRTLLLLPSKGPHPVCETEILH